MHRLLLRRESTNAAIFNLQESARLAKIDFNPFSQGDTVQLRTNGKYTKYCFFLGALLYRLQSVEEACEYFKEAMKSEKFHAAAQGYLGICWARLGPARHSDALHMLQESLNNGSDTLQDTRTVRTTLAALLIDARQNFAGAIEQYSKILEEDAHDSEVLALRGGVFLVSNQYELAVGDFAKCIQLLQCGSGSDHERLNTALYSRARALQCLANYDEAIKDFEAVKGPEMNSPELLGNLASTYEALGQVDQALFVYDKMVQAADKSDATSYASILHRRAALCSVCNHQEQALMDLDTLVTLNPQDVMARHQRGSTLCVKYSGEGGHEADRFLRIALEDFHMVLELNPDHVQARLRRKEVCNILNQTLPDDDAFDEKIKSVEMENQLHIEADLVMDYALKMATDIQSDLKGSQERTFPLFRLRGGKKNVQDRTFWEEEPLTFYCDGRCEIKGQILYLRSSTCIRETFDNGLFCFRMTFVADNRTGVFTLASAKAHERDDVFRYWHRFKDAQSTSDVIGQSPYATPIRLLERVFRLDSKRIAACFHVAQLREQQHQFALAKVTYSSVLEGLLPKHSLAAKAADDWGGKHGNSQVGRECIWTGKMVPPASRHVLGITEPMCRQVPGNHAINQLKSQVFHRLAVMMLEDPSITDSERAKMEVAVWYLRVSVKIDGSQKDAQFKLGGLLLRSDDLEDALRCFRTVTRVAPEFAEAWNNLGVAQDRLGAKDDACKSFQEAMRCKANFQSAICNLSIITLRHSVSSSCMVDATELTKLIANLTESIQHGQDFRGQGTAASQGLAHGLRGLAYQLRDASKRGVQDVRLAMEDYLNAIHCDARNMQGRVGIVCLYLQRQDLGAAYPHLEWLVTHHGARSPLVGDLLLWARKMRMVFEEPIADFLECLRMNPNFQALSLSRANVNIEALSIKEDVLKCIRSEAPANTRHLDALAIPSPDTMQVDGGGAARKDGPHMSAYHYMQMACLSHDQGNFSRALALVFFSMSMRVV